MADSSKKQKPLTLRVAPFRITLIYLLVGGLWIIFSDRLVAALVTDPVALTQMQTYKGWFYIVATALLLYLLIRGSLAALSNSEAELRAISAELQAALQRLTFHVENSPLGVIEWDNQFRVQRWSRQTEQLFGWRAEEVLGKHPKEIGFIYAEDAEAVNRVIAALLEGSRSRSVNRNRNYTKSGAVIDCEWYESAFFDEAGCLISILSLVQDVTAREQAKQALQESEERFRATFEQAAVGLAHLGLDNRWLRVNQKFCDIIGYSFEELGQLTLPQLIYSDDVDINREQARRLVAGEIQTYSLEQRYIRKDFSLVWVNVTVSLLRDASGQPKYFIGVVQDITERKQLEEQYRHAQKMEAVGRLAGGVAHDFNNLLTVINGYSELALHGLTELDPLQKSIREIRKAGERAARLTHQLLAFSRQQVLQPEILDLNEVITDISRMLTRLIGEDIELVIITKAGLGRIKADPGQMEQVIMNLAVNARDAMPHGGKLTIDLANVELDEDFARRHLRVAPGAYVRLAISDTGVGMDKETLNRIFEPFFTTKEQGKGTGLGLATVYGIIKQSGGSILVYSEPGWGTTFKIYLPQIKEVSRPSPVSLPREHPSQRGGTILLVEDEPGVRNLVRDTLKEDGYTVLDASNSAEALLLSEQHPDPIHLLLTDVVMPGLSGRQLAERLLLERPKLKILYMSGYTDDAIVHHGVLEPGVAFLHKPFTLQMLAQKVREVLDEIT
ncbi:MAG: histidine kinase [Chloroflexota bacterium]|nr:MAG: histidine kinase [Chloroflexota bacterium]